MAAAALPSACWIRCAAISPKRQCASCLTSRQSQRPVSTGKASLEARLEHLARLRRDEGYVTVCSRDDDGISWRLEEAHCSVQRIAEEFPAVCDQELLLIRRTVPDCRVERVHWRLEGGHACGFRITPLEQD